MATPSPQTLNKAERIVRSYGVRENLSPVQTLTLELAQEVIRLTDMLAAMNKAMKATVKPAPAPAPARPAFVAPTTPAMIKPAAPAPAPAPVSAKDTSPGV